MAAPHFMWCILPPSSLQLVSQSLHIKMQTRTHSLDNSSFWKWPVSFGKQSGLEDGFLRNLHNSFGSWSWQKNALTSPKHYLLFSMNFYSLWFSCYIFCMCTSVLPDACLMPSMFSRGWTEVTDGWELSRGCREPNPGSLIPWAISSAPENSNF